MSVLVRGGELASMEAIGEHVAMSDEATKRWAAWLRAQLDERGWRPKDLADRSGIGQGNISRWLSGQAPPKPELAALVADTLGIDRATALRVAGHENIVPLTYEEIRERQASGGIIDESILSEINAVIHSPDLSDRQKSDLVRMLLTDRDLARTRLAKLSPE